MVKPKQIWDSHPKLQMFKNCFHSISDLDVLQYDGKRKFLPGQAPCPLPRAEKDQIPWGHRPRTCQLLASPRQKRANRPSPPATSEASRLPWVCRNFWGVDVRAFEEHAALWQVWTHTYFFISYSLSPSASRKPLFKRNTEKMCYTVSYNTIQSSIKCQTLFKQSSWTD